MKACGDCFTFMISNVQCDDVPSNVAVGFQQTQYC